MEAAVAPRTDLAHHRIALKADQGVALSEPQVYVASGKLGKPALNLAVDEHQLHVPHTDPSVGVAEGAFVLIEVVGQHPVFEDLLEGLPVPGHVGLHPVDAVRLLSHQVFQALVTAVVTGQIAQEERGGAVMGPAAPESRPVVQLRAGVGQERPHKRGWISRQLRGDLRHPFVHPRVLTGVQVPMDRMLKLVRQHRKVEPRPRVKPSAVQVYHLSLVAEGVDLAGKLVPGAVVAVDRPQRCVQDGEAGIVVHPGIPDIADVPDHGGVYLVVEDLRGNPQVIDGKIKCVVDVPVGVLADDPESRRDRVTAGFAAQIGDPEALRVALLVAYGLGIHGTRERSIGSRPEPERKLEQVSLRRLRGHVRLGAVVRPD